MNQAQRSQVTHKVILYAIRKQLLTLGTVMKQLLTIATGIFEQELLSNRTIPVLSLAMNPGIDQEIMPIILAPLTIFMPATK